MNKTTEETEKAAPIGQGSSAFESAVTAAVDDRIVTKVGKQRWLICALLFFAATINYIDRQVIGILKPTLEAEFGWSETDYGWIVFAFQTAYALGLLGVGNLMDKIGTKKGFSLSIIVWSIGATMHAWAVPIGAGALGALAWFGFDSAAIGLSVSVVGFIIARFVLGIGEAGNFPASIKTVAEWFPKKERAFATGIFNSGTNIGALATPLIVPWIAVAYGWYEAFIITGIIGFIWLVFWLLLYRKPEEHPKLSKAELDYIQSDPPEPTVKIPWKNLFPHRQTWAFAIGKFLTDPIWWVYLFWLPDFLKKQHGLDLKTFGIPLAIIYIIADVGSIGGGWLSGFFIKRGWSINKSRKTAMLICAIAVVPIIFASTLGSSIFQASDFVNMPALIGKIKDGQDPVSIYIRNQFSPEARQLLEQNAPNQEALVNEFNGLLKGASLYQEQRFEGIQLSQDTKTLLDKNPQKEDLIRLNRMLMEDTYPVEIKRVPRTTYLWIAIILIGIAAAAHQGWSANIFTTASDMFPKQAVGSVVGIGGMAGAIGGMFIAKLVAYILDSTGSYLPIFAIAASAYLVALLIIHLLAPNLEPAKLEEV